MKTQYTVVNLPGAKDFIHSVQLHLDDGWKLYGNPYNTEAGHSQALIKETHPPAVRGMSKGMSQ